MVDNTFSPDILNQMVKQRSAELDRVFHALAHAARRQMLRRLAEGERTLSELAEPLAMSFPAASKHVQVLEQARLVKRRIVGRTHICRLETGPLAQATDCLDEFRRVWEANFDRLDAVLEDLKSQARGKKP